MSTLIVYSKSCSTVLVNNKSNVVEEKSLSLYLGQF